jgi:hypothetical protein
LNTLFAEDDSSEEEIEYEDLDTVLFRQEQVQSQVTDQGATVNTIINDEDEESSGSWIRQHIERIVGTNRVKCLICNNEKGLFFPIEGRKVINLHKHPCFMKVKKVQGEKQIQLDLKMKKVYGPPLSKQKATRVFVKMKKWIVMHEPPFKVMENSDFRDFIYELNTLFRIPAPKTLKKDLFSDWTSCNYF